MQIWYSLIHSILFLFPAIDANKTQYMIILFLLFLIQFSIASSCLAVNSEQQQEFAEEGWNTVPASMHKQVQDTFLCCGFNSTYNSTAAAAAASTTSPEASCDLVNKQCCIGSYDVNCQCPPCLPKLEDKINYAFKLCGGLGIFFSFTEVRWKFDIWNDQNRGRSATAGLTNLFFKSIL